MTQQDRPSPNYGLNCSGPHLAGGRCANYPVCTTQFTGTNLNEACFGKTGQPICVGCLVHEMTTDQPDIAQLNAKIAADPQGALRALAQYAQDYTKHNT